jgi:hypothetical protein
VIPAVPQSTVEKPLTAIDYMVPLEQCTSITDVQRYAEQVPVEVRQDERFTRAVAKRLGEIKGRKAAA